MMTDQPAILTPKAERTRRHILETALGLFTTRGYDETTIRDIATEADCSLGLTYRYFKRKEDLVLALYERMAHETAAFIHDLPAEPVADRFRMTMISRLESAAPFRDALGALFGAAMNPRSDAGLLGTGASDMRDTALAAFEVLVSESQRPPNATNTKNLASLLYSLHFVLILFWLYDRTPHQQATGQLIDFITQMLRLVNRTLPIIGGQMGRLAHIIEAVFVGR